MTWSMFAVGWLSVGDYVRSGMHFRRGYANAQRPFNVWTEVPHGNGYPGCVNFLTGAGGFLQSLIFGTSGMRLRKEGLHFNPPPPWSSNTKATSFILHAFHFLGSQLRQEVTS